MVKTNGKSQVDPQELDIDHELPAADESEAEPGAATGAAPPAGESDIQKLKAERDALLDRLARLQAEFDNARKRIAREQQDFKEFAAAETIKALLPALDSFERALQSPSAQLNEFRGGVELIYKQLQDALHKLGLRAIAAEGQAFDPHQHEAIELVDTHEAPDHQVIEELQRGYKLKERLLRPAMVKVANNPKR